MFQRMANRVILPVKDFDMTVVSDIEVCFEQRSTETELVYKDESVYVESEHEVAVLMPKEDAMLLDDHPVRWQVMFIGQDGYPNATKVKQMPVNELLKDDGYGE